MKLTYGNRSGLPAPKFHGGWDVSSKGYYERGQSRTGDKEVKSDTGTYGQVRNDACRVAICS